MSEQSIWSPGWWSNILYVLWDWWFELSFVVIFFGWVAVMAWLGSNSIGAGKNSDLKTFVKVFFASLGGIIFTLIMWYYAAWFVENGLWWLYFCIFIAWGLATLIIPRMSQQNRIRNTVAVWYSGLVGFSIVNVWVYFDTYLEVYWWVAFYWPWW